MSKQTLMRTVAHAMLPVILIGSLSACSSGSETPVEDAVSAIEKQDYRSARIHLMTALRQDSQDPETNFLYAKTMMELGDGVAAEAALRKIAANEEYKERVQPMLGRALLFNNQNEKALALVKEPAGKFAADLTAIKALALLDLKRPKEADATLREGLQANPGHAELNWVNGNRQLEVGNLEGAAKSSNAALKAAPKRLEALLLAGRAALAMADGKKALSYFEQASALRPDNIMPEFLSGTILKDFGDDDAARKSFKTVLSNSPNHPVATYLVAQMDYDEGKKAEAFKRIQSSKADMTKVPKAQRLIGLIESNKGNHEQAIEHLKRYLVSGAPDATTILALAKSLKAAGNEQEAISVVAPLALSLTAPADALNFAAELVKNESAEDAAAFEKRAAALEKDDVTNSIFQAEHAIIAQEWDKAAKIYEQLLVKDHPQKVMFLNNAALARLNLSNGDQALEFAKKANVIVPNDAIIKDTLGWIMLQTGKDKMAALTLLKQAAADVPENSEIRWHLATALVANGEKAEAKKVVKGLQNRSSGIDSAAMENLLSWN